MTLTHFIQHTLLSILVYKFIILFHFGQDREKAEYISFLLAASKKCGFFAAPNINENMENI
jgi:hypothetical protein